jgi:hypothetical protein
VEHQKVTPVFANIRDQHNLGDMLCSAKSVFPELSGAPVYDFRAVPEGSGPLIVGGGGMLHPGVDLWIDAQARKRPVVVFGVGINYHNGASIADWQSKLWPCLLVGLRDKRVVLNHSRFAYCPCPTTGAIDWRQLASEATHDQDLLLFEHFDRPMAREFGLNRLGSRGGLEIFTNRWSPGVDLTSVARSLGQYRHVVTNSYHGALWSLRMGCRVALFRPFSSRFDTGLPCRLPRFDELSQMAAAFAVWDDEKYRSDVAAALNADFEYLDDFREQVRILIP